MAISEQPWFADTANYKATKSVPNYFTWQPKKMFYKEVKYYLCDEPCLFRVSAESLIQRCVVGKEVKENIWHCRNSTYGGHNSGERTTAKVLQSGFWWPTLFKDCKS